MSVASSLITAEQLLAMGGGRRELVKGEVVEMPPAGSEHGKRANRIAVVITLYADKNRLGTVYAAETGFIVERNPDTVRAPDVSFVRAGRTEDESSGFFPGAPDLAVEVLSPGDSVVEVETKVDQYLAAGCRLVWVVNPRRQTVTAYQPNARPRLLVPEDTIDTGDVLPGFSVSVAEFFR